jgi:hypothetical protein
MPEKPIPVTLEELRDIILGLRLSNFSYIDRDALDEINAMIKTLPSAEALSKMEMYPESIEKIQADVGKIMRLIEIYGKRGPEHRARYKSRTGLPPRYKVLEWRSAMNLKLAKNELIKDIIKLSKEADDDGLERLSSDLISIAKKVKSDTLTPKDIYDTSVAFYRQALGRNIMVKEAQVLTDIQFDLSDIKNGLNQITQWFVHINKALEEKGKYLQQNVKTNRYMKALENISKQVMDLYNKSYKQIVGIDQAAEQLETQMEQELVPKGPINYNGKMYNIEYIDDITNDEYQVATIKLEDGYHEVQLDTLGKYHVKKEPVSKMAAEGPLVGQPAAQKPAAKTPVETQSQGAVPTGKTEVSTLVDGKNILTMRPQELQALYKNKQQQYIQYKSLPSNKKDYRKLKQLEKDVNIVYDRLLAASTIFNLRRYKISQKV